MDNLTIEQKTQIYQNIESRIPEKWWSYHILKKDDYAKDFAFVFNKTKETNFEYFLSVYFECISDIINSILYNSDSFRLKDYKGNKKLIGVDKDGLALDYRNYLKHGFYSELIEFITLIGFLGHEYETFVFEMSAVNKNVGLLTRLFNPQKAMAIEKIPALTASLKKLYEIVLSPQPSIEMLETLIKLALQEKCYIHPCVHTILERSREAGLKRFLINT
ncbi:MAG: hypothetical protein ACXVCR_07420 [Bdellovibrio sp.]